MKISREAKRTARELLQLSIVNGRLDQARIASISARLVETKPRSFLSILKEYTRLVRLELAKRHAVVESSAALPADEAKNIEQTLKKQFGEDITTEFQVIPSLLGGLRIKVGSDVWDGSIKARLTALTQQL